MGQSTSRRTIRAGRSNIAHSNNIATLTPSRNAVPTDPPTPGASSTATTPNSESAGSGSRTEIDSSVHDKVISQQQPIPRKSKGTRASLVAAKRRLSGLFPKRHSTASARLQDSDSHGPVIDLSSPDSLSVPPSISPPVPGTPVLLDQHEISGSSVELVLKPESSIGLGASPGDGIAHLTAPPAPEPRTDDIDPSFHPVSAEYETPSPGPSSGAVTLPPRSTSDNKGKQKEVAASDPSDVEPEGTPGTSMAHDSDQIPSTGTVSDSLREERIAAARAIIETLHQNTPEDSFQRLIHRLNDRGEATDQSTDFTAEGSGETPQGFVHDPPTRPRINLPERSETLPAIANPTPRRAPSASMPASRPTSPLPITSGTAMIVQGVVQTTDLTRGSQSRGLDRAPSFRRGLRMPRSSSPFPNTARENPNVMNSSSFGRPPLASNSPSDSVPPAPSPAPPSLNDSAEGIDVLTMLLGVVTAATGASLMNGSTMPNLSAVPDLVSRANSDSRPLPPSTLPTPISPVTPSPFPSHTAPTQAPPARVNPPADPVSRPRRILDSVRSRLLGIYGRSSSPSSAIHPPSHSSTGIAPPMLPESRTVVNNDTGGPPSTSTPTSRFEEGTSMAHLRQTISQQLARALSEPTTSRGIPQAGRVPLSSASPALGNHGHHSDVGSLIGVDGPIEPANVPLPEDEDEDLHPSIRLESDGSDVAAVPVSPTATDEPSARHSPSPVTPGSPEEGSFDRFLIDIQADLRSTLLQRQEQDRLRREHGSRPSRPTPSSSHGGSASTTSAAGPSNASNADERHRYLEENVPTVDSPLNWWRMYRFPTRSVPSGSVPTPGSPSPAAYSGVPSSQGPSEFPTSPPSPSYSLHSSPPTDPSSASGGENVNLTPVLIVGLRQQRIDVEEMFDDPISPPTPPLSDYSRTGDDFDFSRYLPSPPSTSTATSRPNSSELPTLPPFPSSLSDFDVPAEWDDYRRAPDSHRTVSPPRLDNDTDRTYGESWRDQARAFLSSALARGALERHREERAAMRERQARRDARRRREAQARESYVIMAIAGFYPDHMLLAPNLFLGQFDHDDFWALAELLGQVKPPVATKDDIEHSGLPVVKTEKISEYAENGLIATNTIERCLVCLSDYEEQEDIRILSCKHAFHKDCVDKWMEVGRNNCPACRTKGVPTDS